MEHGEVRLDQIPPELIESARFWFEDLLSKACDSSEGELSPTRLIREAQECRAAIWAASDSANPERPLAVAVTRLENWGGESILRILCLAGTERDRWLHLLERLEDLARLHGVNRIIWEGRRGWARLMPEYTVARFVMMKRLNA